MDLSNQCSPSSLLYVHVYEDLFTFFYLVLESDQESDLVCINALVN